MAEAVFLVDIDAAPADILTALTTQEGIRAWWTSDANVTDDALDLGFPDVPMRFDLGVSEVTDTSVTWTSRGEFPPHWQGTTIAWQVMDNDEGPGSRVFFTHAGFAAPDPMLGHTAYTWAQLMSHLRQQAETNDATPFFG